MTPNIGNEDQSIGKQKPTQMSVKRWIKEKSRFTQVDWREFKKEY